MKGTFIIDHVPTGIQAKDLFLREIHLIQLPNCKTWSPWIVVGKDMCNSKGTCTLLAHTLQVDNPQIPWLV